MTKSDILAEIQRTAKANGGVALGRLRFENETGIGYYDWFGKYWTRWNDAVKEAGLLPNRMSAAYESNFLLDKLVHLTRKLGRVPTQGDMLLTRRTDPSFPSEKVFRRLGSKAKRTEMLILYCKNEASYADVISLWEQEQQQRVEKELSLEETTEKHSLVGFVYLLKHGSRREYKIGRTFNPIRREGEIGIQLPEKLQPIHYIQTDDPAGIEAYWHARFANKRKEGEWFELSSQDVRSFKRWKRIY